MAPTRRVCLPASQSRYQRRSVHALAVALLLAAAATLPAPTATALDLTRSYELALTNDRQLKAAKARADAGRELRPQAIAQVLPNVAFSGAYGETDQQRTTAGVVTLPWQRYRSTNYSLTLKQPIYRQYQFSQIGQATAKVAASDAQYDSSFQELGLRLVTTYFEALLARDALELIIKQRSTYETQLRAARLAFAAGSGTRTDIDDIQARLDMLIADEIAARQAIDATTLHLRNFVGEPIDNLVSLDPRAFAAEAHDPGVLSRWVDRATTNSPYLKVLKSNWEAATSTIDMAKAGHLPTLDLVAQTGFTQGDSTQTIPSTENKTNYIGVQLSVPIYSGGGVSSQVRQAIALAEEARESYEYTLQDLRLKVQQQFDAVKAGISRVRALEQAIVSADQNVLSNVKGVQAGTRTTLDVLTVEQQRLQTQLDLTKARYQVLVSYTTLLSYVGDLDGEQVARLNRVLKATGEPVASIHRAR